jgi:hypothetical protein
MKLILVKVKGTPGAVVGYCAGAKGQIYAIVISEDKFLNVKLDDLELISEVRTEKKKKTNFDIVYPDEDN